MTEKGDNQVLYLRKLKSGVYYFIRPIPKQLHKQYSTDRFSRSLGTKDFATAKKLAYDMARTTDLELQERLSALEQQSKPSVKKNTSHKILTLNSATVEALAGIFKHELLVKDDKDRAEIAELAANVNRLWASNKELGSKWAEMNKMDRRSLGKEKNNSGELNSRLFDGLNNSYQSKLNQYLLWISQNLIYEFNDIYGEFVTRHNLDIQPSASHSLDNLKLALMVAASEAYEELVNRSIGKRQPTEKFEPKVGLNFKLSDGKNMLSLWELWRKEKGSDLNEKTDTAYKYTASEFNKFVNGKPVANLARNDFLDWIDSLAADGYSERTVKNKIKNIQAMIRVGIIHTVITADHTLKLKPKGRVKEDRRAFTTDEVKAVLLEVAQTPKRKGDYAKKITAYQWLTLLAYTTGARIEELAQLTFDDIYIEDERWVLRLADTQEGQHIKNKSSIRRIPLHTDLGAFCDYVTEQKCNRKGENPFVFDQLEPNSRGIRSDGFSKWLGRKIDAVNKDDSICAHSFRHLMRHLLSSVTSPVIIEEVKDRLLGHTNGSVGRNYGATYYPLAPLLDAVDRLELPAPVFQVS